MPNAASESKRLRYVNANEPGVTRRRTGKYFRYYAANGKPLRSAAAKRRIEQLVIPPAWKDVWICRDERGHLQATGIDARGRKQYLYHEGWRRLQESAKYDRCLGFAKQLPKIRQCARRAMHQRSLTREKVLAAIISLLDTTLIRVGNDEYRRKNGSFGLTTLLDRHASIRAGGIEFAFRGKSGVEHEIGLQDFKLAKIVKQCQELPGQQLFQYRDEAGKTRDITSSDVNRYLQEITNDNFTAKDFRTWAATRCIAEALIKEGDFESEVEAESNIKRAIKEVASQLGNTVAVCRSSYIHPQILSAYKDRSFRRVFAQGKAPTRKVRAGLSAHEKRLLTLLRGKEKKGQSAA